ncbi:MAG: hypothetical protein JXN61_14190 [Sedimentisphaerales bacterium]|nr:hypothetical protein [Sedimentisphaerales bacterium]
MIKTLQISSILAVALAAVLFVSSIVIGTAHGDDQIAEYLKSPSVRDQFVTMGITAKKQNNSQRSPLVEKAELFAKILNPPKPPKPEPKLPTEIVKELEIPKPAGPVTPKFTLVGTVVCESDPQNSLALVDEPGKGPHLVRQGSEIMKLTIELVKDGSIVVRDATGTSEMTVEEAPVSTLPSPATAATASAIPPRSPVSPALGRAVGPSGPPPRANVLPQPGPGGRRGPATPASIRDRLTNEENARLAALGDRLKAVRDAKAGKVAEKTEAEADAEAAAVFKKLMTDSSKDQSESNSP